MCSGPPGQLVVDGHPQVLILQNRLFLIKHQVIVPGPLYKSTHQSPRLILLCTIYTINNCKCIRKLLSPCCTGNHWCIRWPGEEKAQHCSAQHQTRPGLVGLTGDTNRQSHSHGHTPMDHLDFPVYPHLHGLRKEAREPTWACKLHTERFKAQNLTHLLWGGCTYHWGKNWKKNLIYQIQLYWTEKKNI